MELPENGLEFWKAKFIDGLPSLFAERVKKTLRDPQGIIPYSNFTYGKLIGACTQEGINLCNELKLSRQLKMDKLREKSQLGDFCTHFGLPDASKGTNRETSKSESHRSHHKKRRSRRKTREERDERRAHRKSHRFTKNRSRFIVFYTLLVSNQIMMILKQVMQHRMSNLSLLRFIKIRMMLANVMVMFVTANMMNSTSYNLSSKT
ncbi:hypothetical protein H5410_051092 [Solanum commersonii]|uniref:Uncharacterized protein n=1 Tax=Solanum commersonii TaxID=4109 RepID=A0A9J5WX89_SOLCO|nr:hypothetical protein H5410_051092 [Solanum commersonii]